MREEKTRTFAGTGEGLHLRPMRPEDVADVARIEFEAFTNPWSEETFRSLLGTKGVVTRVLASPGGRIGGYAVLWIVLSEGELANLALHRSLRGRGLGGRLLDAVLGEARRLGIEVLHLEVRESNRRARALYEGRGFRLVGRRRDYYSAPREDALLLSKKLD